MAELRASQLISHINSFLSAATRRLDTLVASGDNLASSVSDMHGASAHSSETWNAPEFELPAAPAQMRSTADCESYLALLPGGPAAIIELAARAADFTADAARHRIRPELAGPQLHNAVMDVSSRLVRQWSRSAEAFDSEMFQEPFLTEAHTLMLTPHSSCTISLAGHSDLLSVFAEHVAAAELALESVLARDVHEVVFPALTLRFYAQDAALYQLLCDLIAGEHQVLLRSNSMRLELQAAVRSQLSHAAGLPSHPCMPASMPT
jgi:hypothetical protein